MNIISLPVSRLSYKIITKDYGNTPITLHQRHPLWATVVHAPGVKGRGGPYDRHIQITLPPDTLLDQPAASRWLHNTHVERMMVWTQALNDNCLPARTALNRFYEFYNLDDSDYDFSQTAYKSWQRWKERHDEECRRTPAKPASFHEMYVLRNVRLLQPLYKPVTNAELELRCDLLAMRLFNLDPATPDYLYRQVAIFIWKIEGGRSGDELAALFNIDRSNITRAVGKVMHTAKHDQNFRGIFE